MESREETTPKYLYKILSLRNWQSTQNRGTVTLSADDDAFIHFSKEDQLERILAKFWADAPGYAVLKIDTALLEGRLVYETNPGGTAKYYHLYQGFIPFQAIIEAKITYREGQEVSKPHQLEILQIGDPLLRQQALPLTEKEILSQEIQDLIQEMKAMMRAAPGVGLAAPQVGKMLQIVVIEDMDHSRFTPEQLKERERVKVPFHVLINPKIHLDETEKAEFFEGCLSVAPLLAVVPRAKRVRVEYLDENAKPKVIEAQGWYARILQHEIDHLSGILLVDRAITRTFTNEENYVKFWKK